MECLKERLRRGDFLAGTHINACDPTLTELLGSCGFDYLWIDTEHTAIERSTLQGHLIAARAAGCPAVVRVAWNDPILVKRILEQDPDGIVFPMICSRQQAQQAVDACRYPPVGARSFGPIRASGYGRLPLRDYLAHAQRLCCLVQIEHIEAVRALDEILSVEGIDGVILGPCDLSASMGLLGQTDAPEVAQNIDAVIARCKQRGMPVGVSLGPSSEDVLRNWKARGVQLLSSNSEYGFLSHGAATLCQILKA